MKKYTSTIAAITMAAIMAVSAGTAVSADTYDILTAGNYENDGISSDITIVKGEHYLIDDFANENTVWSSLDRSIAKVSNDGIVTGVNPGRTTIIANDNGYVTEYDIRVIAGTIEVSENNVTLNEGEKAEVRLTVRGSHVIKAVSDNLSVASVGFTTKEFNGDNITLRISGRKAGTVSVRVYLAKDESVYKDITVNVKAVEPEKSSVYSYSFRYYSFETGFYYKNYADAVKASNNNSAVVYNGQVQSSWTYGTNYPYFSSYTNMYYTDYTMAVAASRGNSAYVTKKDDKSSVYSYEYTYYSFTTGYYYRTYTDAVSASGNDSSVVYNGQVKSSYVSGYGYPYYSCYTNMYYSDYTMALAASHGNSAYVTKADDKSSVYSYEYSYYSFTTGYYYRTYTDAVSASGNDSSVVYNGQVQSSYSFSSYYPYFSSYTNMYYTNYSMALAASHGNDYYVTFFSGDC